MRRSERTIYNHLLSLNLGEVLFEPDGNVPPDFLVDGRIAVEARRLNQHELAGRRPRGLEVTSIPLLHAVSKVLGAFGPPLGGNSWFVFYTFRRPLPPWKAVEKRLQAGLSEFVARLDAPPEELWLAPRLRLRFAKATDIHEHLFVLGGYSDQNAGGFVVAEIIENMQLCISEKAKKVAPHRHRYREWWLAFEDRIGHGDLDAQDVDQIREHLRVEHTFARIILVDPSNSARAISL